MSCRRTSTTSHDWPHRCDICDLPCNSAVGVTIHKGHAHKDEKVQNFTGTLADSTVKTQKLKQAQAQKATVNCGDQALDNVFNFNYLGSLFSADADQTRDVKKRIALARTRFGKLRHVFGSKDLPTNIKLRLYEAAVCSILVYGCESWMLDEKTMRHINGASSRMLAIITGNPIQTEARPLTTSLNLIRKLRIRRHKWLGHILRDDPSRLITQAVKTQRALGLEGSLLMDAPPHSTFQELVDLAADRATWADSQKDIPRSHHR